MRIFYRIRLPRPTIFWTTLFLVMVGSAQPLPAQPLDPVGVGAMVDLDKLPVLRTHTIARQVSSYDPTGGNDDGFYSVNFLYHDKARKEFVLLEEQGPGCIYRIQVADLRSFFGPAVNIRIYLEGASVPQIDLDLEAFFSGHEPPFNDPVAGATHREVGPGYGYYSYVPIPFQNGVRVALTGLVHFYNISYHMYRNGIGTVPGFGHDRNIHEMTSLWHQVPNRPTPVHPGEKTRQTPVSLAPSASTAILDITGQGVVSVIELTSPELSGSGKPDLSQVRLKMFWDNETAPSVDAPLSLFFATGIRESNVESLMVGAIVNQRLYCYFPMPFWQRARIVLENKTTGTLLTNATVVSRTSSSPIYNKNSAGYFRCVSREEDPVRSKSDFIALSTGGRGHLVGTVLDMAGKDLFHYENYLEGDERIYIDFNRTPCSHGNGTEDFFNGAYYFLEQTPTMPQHGSPFRNVTPNENRRLAYRLFTGDALPFRAHLRIGFEVGGYSHLRAHYRSAAFYYHQPDPALTLSDRLNLGDPVQETGHNYSTTGSRIGPTTGAFEGDQDDIQITDQGVQLGVGKSSSFTVSIPLSNDGVVIRRRLDYLNNNVSDQTAQVEVNSQIVGTWLIRGHYLNHIASFPNLPGSRSQGTPDKRWLESDFHIPAMYTHGRSSLTIKLTNTGSGIWNAYEYRILVYLRSAAPDTQAPGIPGNVQGQGQTTDSVILTWDEAVDNAGIDHYEVWRSHSKVHPATLIGTTIGTRYHDNHADPATSMYYYHVRAVDAAGNMSAFSTPATGGPGRILHYECEELLPTVHSTGDIAGQLDLTLFPHLGRLWSGDNQVLFVANAYGDWISYPLPVTIPGTYELKLAFTSFVGTSSFEVLVDEVPAGPPVHHPLRIVRREAAFPPRFFFPGIHTVKIRLVEGPAVHNGTQVALDCLTLTPK